MCVQCVHIMCTYKKEKNVNEGAVNWKKNHPTWYRKKCVELKRRRRKKTGTK